MTTHKFAVALLGLIMLTPIVLAGEAPDFDDCMRPQQRGALKIDFDGLDPTLTRCAAQLVGSIDPEDPELPGPDVPALDSIIKVIEDSEVPTPTPDSLAEFIQGGCDKRHAGWGNVANECAAKCGRSEYLQVSGSVDDNGAIWVKWSCSDAVAHCIGDPNGRCEAISPTTTDPRVDGSYGPCTAEGNGGMYTSISFSCVSNPSGEAESQGEKRVDVTIDHGVARGLRCIGSTCGEIPVTLEILSNGTWRAAT